MAKIVMTLIDRITLWEGQDIADADKVGGLCQPRTIQADLAAFDKCGGKCTALAETRLPEPLVDPNPLAVQDQILSRSPMSAAANGLSGSIRSFFLGGRASKERPSSRRSGLPPLRSPLPLKSGFPP